MLGVWPVCWVYLQHRLYHVWQCLRVSTANFGILPLCHFFVQAVHVLRPEWRLQCAHLINDAAQAPYVWLGVIGLVLPYLWACIIGRSSLGVKKAILGYFGNVHISELNEFVFTEEDVSTLNSKYIYLHVPMENVEIMQSLESESDLNKCLPDEVFLEKLLVLLLIHNFLVQVSIIRKLHHYASWKTKYHRELDSIKACL